MKSKIIHGCRLLFGLAFIVFGLNGFFGFIPMPAPPEAGGAYLGALGATGYFFPVLKICEILAGIFILTNIFLNFGLVLIAPILVQIFLYHLFLDPAGLALPIILVVMHLFLTYQNCASYKSLFSKSSSI